MPPPSISAPTPYSRAVEIVAAHAPTSPPGDVERMPLLQAAGRVLAEVVTAGRDQPPFDRSTRDGFAVRAAELTSGCHLTIIGTLRAGEAWPSDAPPIARGQTIRIMTGAPVPADFDSVVMVEHVTESADGMTIALNPGRSLNPGDNIVPAGAEARSGTTLLSPGIRLNAAHIGLAAATGLTRLTVYRQPRVAIFATGDELLEPGSSDPVQPEQIYNSNTFSLSAQTAEAGAIPIPLPIARDTHESIRQSIAEAFSSNVIAELLILSGGVSMGKYDLVEEVLAELGAESLFTSVAIQPGKPVVFGRIPRISPEGQDRYFFGLPGNPVSTMVTFSLFVRPFLAALCGETAYTPPFVTARLTEPMRAAPGITRFLPAFVRYDISSPTVTPIPWQGSGDLAAIARANCYLVLPPDIPSFNPGDLVQILLKPLS